MPSDKHANNLRILYYSISRAAKLSAFAAKGRIIRQIAHSRTSPPGHTAAISYRTTARNRYGQTKRYSHAHTADKIVGATDRAAERKRLKGCNIASR